MRYDDLGLDTFDSFRSDDGFDEEKTPREREIRQRVVALPLIGQQPDIRHLDCHGETAGESPLQLGGKLDFVFAVGARNCEVHDETAIDIRGGSMVIGCV